MVKPVVVGDNLASAVFAFERIRAGLEVSIASDVPITTKFSGMTFGTSRVDRGMVLIEPERKGITKTGIENYNGEYRTNAIQYLGSVADWFQEAGLQFEVTKVETYFRGQTMKDFFISDSLEIFGQLNAAEISVVQKELEATKLWLDSANHPKNKNGNVWYESRKYADVAQRIFGETFFSLVLAPYLQKLYGSECRELVASEHRSAWLPIFYPESLLLGASGRETHIDEKVFTYPTNQGFAQFMHELELTVENSVKRYRVNPDDSLTTNPARLLADETSVFFGNPKKIKKMETFDSRICSGKSVYIEAKSLSSRTVFIVDSEIDAFRFNVRPSSRVSEGYVSIEFGASALNFDNSYLIKQSLELSEKWNVQVDPGSAKVFDSKFPLRTGQSGSISADLLEVIDELRSISVFGYPICEVNGAINDQICAALGTLSDLKNLE
jgi:hypothetical protein